MWHKAFTINTDVAPEAVWRALHELQTGVVPLGNGDRRCLDDQFTVGGTITVTPQGLDPLQSTITELIEGRILAERTQFGELILVLRHTVGPSGGGAQITREIEIDGAQADEQGPSVGPRISEDYPEALAEIVMLAREGQSSNAATGTQ